MPGAAGQRYRNPLSALSLWKIADNLRRSLVPVALLLLLLTAWIVLPSALAWTLVAVGIVLVPPLLGSVLQLLRKPRDAAVRQHLAAAVRSVATQWSQAGLSLACLPYEAFTSADAVLRTTWRLLVSHQRRLEWSPSGDPTIATCWICVRILRRCCLPRGSLWKPRLDFTPFCVVTSACCPSPVNRASARAARSYG